MNPTPRTLAVLLCVALCAVLGACAGSDYDGAGTSTRLDGILEQTFGDRARTAHSGLVSAGVTLDGRIRAGAARPSG